MTAEEVDPPRPFRFEVTRRQYAAPSSTLFAGRPLRELALATCSPFVIRWREAPAGTDDDVLVVEGTGPRSVVTRLQAFAMGHAP